MSILLSMPELTELKPRITVIGVGGAGGNAVNNMIESNLQGVEFVVGNTDAQALLNSKADRRIQLGGRLTQGLGAGARPEVGRAAAEETLDQIMEYLTGSHMVFITAGMGGGTGTGAAPVIARAAREQGILTVGVVTRPFQFEGTRRLRLAEEGINELQKYVDTLIIIPNQNLFRIATEKTTFADAFAMADEVLHSGVRGITDLMVMPGLVNLDFADVRTVMSEMGKAMMGTGEAEGESRALDAAEAAISNPLLDEVSMKGAKAVLINITGGMDLTLFEMDEAANRIRSEVDPDANILVGSTLDEAMNGRMRVSVVATGIEAGNAMQARAEQEQAEASRKAKVEGQTQAQAQTAAPAPAQAEAASGVPAQAAVFEAGPVSLAAAVPIVPLPIAADETATGLGAEEEQAPAPDAPEAPAAPERVQVAAAPFIDLQLAAAPAAETGYARAPEMRQPAAERAEAPSWFERMTGRGRKAAEPRAMPAFAERKPPVAPAPEPQAEVAPEPTVQTAASGRGPADERLASSRKLEDQLEIPTFLRRQAN